MKTFRGVLRTGELEEKFELTFDDAEADALNVYVADGEKLFQRSFLRSVDNFRLSLKFSGLQTSQPESSVETGPFDEEQWAAFLHLFRPLAGLNNDKQVYGFLRVRKLIERRAISNQRLCGYLNHLLAQFQVKRLPLEMTFGIGGKEFDLEGAFDLWMNAMEFHRDPDKRLIIDQINKFLSASGMRTLMAHLAVEKLRAMGELRRLIVLVFSPPGTEVSLAPNS